jgi:ankyrin repeat protein
MGKVCRKNWKSRFFVLFHDGTLAYYKAKTKRRMKGCIKLNEGVVSVQHLDIRRSQKPYVFQVEKGFYRMWCWCCSQLEAELWVTALREVRQSGPPCFEPMLTVPEEQLGCAAVNRQLNKIFVKDERIMSMLQAHKNAIVSHTVNDVYALIGRLEDAILDRYQGFLYMDPEVQLLSGNDLVKLLRRHVEDRAFIPTASPIYAALDNHKTRAARTRITRNVKLLKKTLQRDLGVPTELVDISSNWAHAVIIINALDCVTLISHKIELIISARDSIVSRVVQHHGPLAEISDKTLSAIFRYVLVHCSLDDIAVLHGLLKPVYTQHPACHNQSNVIAAFIDAIAWLDAYQVKNDDAAADSAIATGSIASARVEVSISTAEVGILFTTDGNGRGAVVHTVRKLSQAAMSEKIIPGLSLIAINDEPVILMPFRDICHRLRTAALPKRLTFLPEFYYYQLLSLDTHMYQYLMCLGAGRGDRDSVAWFVGSHLDLNDLCAWERTRGQYVLGFTPPSSRDSALHAAAHNGHPTMVEYLLGIGARPNLEDRYGRTPLHVLSPVSPDMVAVIQVLQTAGAELDAKDGEGMTPLMTMARRRSLEGVTTLLALGARVDSVAWSTGYTALEYAVVDGAVDVVELLLSKGADPNHVTLDGDTSLHLAAAAGDADMLQVLINAGGDANRQNRFGQVPAASLLSLATRHLLDSAQACLAILANASSEVRKPDLLGRHLLHLAQLANDDKLREFMLTKFNQNDAESDGALDIFGFKARDYNLENGSDTASAHQRLRHPRDFFSWSSKDLRGGSARRNSSLSRAKSFDELMQTLLHDVSVDLADLAAFVMFLDSFASADAVVKYLREFLVEGSQGKALIVRVRPVDSVLY